MMNRLWGIPQRWTCTEGQISCDCEDDDGCEVCCGLEREVWREDDGWYVWHHGCGAHLMGPFPCARSAWDFYRVERAPVFAGMLPGWATGMPSGMFWRGFPHVVCGRVYLFARHAPGRILEREDRWFCVYDPAKREAA